MTDKIGMKKTKIPMKYKIISIVFLLLAGLVYSTIFVESPEATQIEKENPELNYETIMIQVTGALLLFSVASIIYGYMEHRHNEKL